MTVIENEEFIRKFMKFSTQQYENKLVNFNTQFSVLNLLSLQQNVDKIKMFTKIKESLRIALMEEQVMYLQCGTRNGQLTGQEIIQWLECVTQGKCFEMVHKIVNKEVPEDNVLWFCSESFSTLQAYFANEIQKSIIKQYIKRQTVSNQKLIHFSNYVSKKHPQHSFLLKLSIQQMSKMSQQQKQQFTNIIKGYQSVYYEDVRQSFIESMQSLQNNKQLKKKKKQKRKLYKRKQNDNNIQEQLIQNDENKCVMNNKSVFIDEEINERQYVIKETKVVEKHHRYVQKIVKVQQQQQHKEKDKVQQVQHTQQTQTLQQVDREQDVVLNNNNKPQQVVIITPSNINQPKQDIPQQQTASFLPSQTASLSTKSKNIVYSRQRQRSPYSRSNIVDNQCSMSQLSGEIYQTYTQCVRQDDQQQKNQNYQLFQIDGHPLEIDSTHNNSMNKHNHVSKQIIDVQGQNDRLKKRRKRKNNNGNNNNTQPSINNQLSNKIKSHCHKSYTSNLTHFIDHLSIQTNNLYESKIVVFERIRYFIKAFYPQSEIMLFGSNSIGLSLASSDVDVMVLNIKCSRKQQVKQILAQIAIEINVMAWVVSCSTYLGAKTPLVKLQIDPLISYYQTKRKSDYCIYHPQLHQYLDIKDRKKAKNISLDLTISLQPTPYSPSTQLMRSYLNTNPLLQRIILFIKYVLTTKAYNKNFSGGLGSYCLFIMITAYFQQHPQCMQKDQGEVLLDVLKFYSEEFQNLVTSITLRQNASCFISLEESLTMANFSQSILSNPLRIIDPLTQKLTSSSCSQYHLIKQQFRRIRVQILAHLQSIHNEVLPNFTQKSMKNDGLDKNIQKMVHKSQAKRKGWLKRLIEGKNENR